jgi:hypothetical protein
MIDGCGIGRRKLTALAKFERGRALGLIWRLFDEEAEGLARILKQGRKVHPKNDCKKRER